MPKKGRDLQQPARCSQLACSQIGYPSSADLASQLRVPGTRWWVTAGLLPSLDDQRGTFLGRWWTAIGAIVTAVIQALCMLTQLDRWHPCWTMAYKSATR